MRKGKRPKKLLRAIASVLQGDHQLDDMAVEIGDLIRSETWLMDEYDYEQDAKRRQLGPLEPLTGIPGSEPRSGFGGRSCLGTATRELQGRR